MKKSIIYKGVEITYSCGYYYPSVNQNIEYKTIKQVKDWVDNVWLKVQKGLDRLAVIANLDRAMLGGFFLEVGQGVHA